MRSSTTPESRPRQREVLIEVYRKGKIIEVYDSAYSKRRLGTFRFSERQSAAEINRKLTEALKRLGDPVRQYRQTRDVDLEFPPGLAAFAYFSNG